MRSASLRQIAMFMFVLPTLLICSTRTSANCLISGTASTSSEPRIDPALYSDSAIVEAPRPAIVPPVERTTTTGNCCVVICALLAAEGSSVAVRVSSAHKARRQRLSRIELIEVPFLNGCGDGGTGETFLAILTGRCSRLTKHR